MSQYKFLWPYREDVYTKFRSYLWELWTGPTGPAAEVSTDEKVILKRKLFDDLDLWLLMRVDYSIVYGPHINTDYVIPSTGQQWKDLAKKKEFRKKFGKIVHEDHVIPIEG